jgi:hypothetical protein
MSFKTMTKERDISQSNKNDNNLNEHQALLKKIVNFQFLFPVDHD